MEDLRWLCTLKMTDAGGWWISAGTIVVMRFEELRRCCDIDGVVLYVRSQEML